FFFFQAEDGIRDYKVTGVQTCALPISSAAETRALPSTGRAVAACASGTGAIEVRKAAVTAATSVLTHTTAAVIWLECTGSHRAPRAAPRPARSRDRDNARRQIRRDAPARPPSSKSRSQAEIGPRER